MGASPDGVIECTCCGRGVLEIKCPFSCRNTSLLERINESSYFLQQYNGETTLNVYHSYYFQVQAQLKLCGVRYCDFVVWREGEIFMQRIYLDEPFISIIFDKAAQFIKLAILPELLGKWYTSDPLIQLENQVPEELTMTSLDGDKSGHENKTDKWCYCQGEEFGEMIACDNSQCCIQWFHTQCLHISRIPKGKWYCPDCQKKLKKQNK